MLDKYNLNQLEKVKETDEYGRKIIIISKTTSTNVLSITEEQFQAIRLILIETNESEEL